MTDGFAAGIEDDGIASTIADDHTVASIQDETLPLMFGDKLPDGFTHFGRLTPASLTLHVFLLDSSGLCFQKAGVLFLLAAVLGKLVVTTNGDDFFVDKWINC